jgi:hypothetical protein
VKIADVVGGPARPGVQCAVNSVDPNLATPYVETWTLSVQQALRSNLVLDVAYVGNHGTKLLGRYDQNEPALGQVWNTPISGVPGTQTFAQQCAASPSSSNCNGSSSAFNAAVTAARPYATKFPYISTIQRLANLDTSNYNALQVSLTARGFHGLSNNFGYTWSQALDINSGNGGGIGTNSQNVSLDYGRAASDLRHRVTMSPSYALPSIQGHWGLLEGWKVNGIFRYATGRPTQSGTQWGDPEGVGRTTGMRPDFSGDPKDFVSDYTQQNIAIFHPGGTTASGINPQTGLNYVASDLAVNTSLCSSNARSIATLTAFGCWTMGNSAITPAPLGQPGTMARGQLNTAGFMNIDTSVTKRQKITERLTSEFRAELFNVLNHPVIGAGSTNLGCSSSGCSYFVPSNTPDVAATNPVLGSGGARRIQFGVKLLF